MTFDWAQIAYIGSPLLTPWWAAANVVGGLVLVMWIVAPILCMLHLAPEDGLADSSKTIKTSSSQDTYLSFLRPSLITKANLTMSAKFLQPTSCSTRSPTTITPKSTFLSHMFSHMAYNSHHFRHYSLTPHAGMVVISGVSPSKLSMKSKKSPASHIKPSRTATMTTLYAGLTVKPSKQVARTCTTA